MRFYLTFFLLLLVLSATAQPRAYKSPGFAADWSKPGLHPDHIVLNFSDDPAITTSVTWRTSPEVTEGYAEVALSTPAPKFWRNAQTIKATTETMDASEVLTAEVVANYHSVTFTDLVPDTLYAYRVGDGNIWSEWIQFRTASAEPEPFSFLYVGDAQNYILELWSRLIREGYRKAPDASFIIHAGDLVTDAHSERQWHEWFTAGGWIHRMLPSIPVPGNHEFEPYTEEEDKNDIEHLSIQWNPQFTLPTNGPAGLEETSYYVDYQGVRILALNSSEQPEEQAAWMEEVLADNPNEWTVATFHHPLFSASAGRNNNRLREMWKPIFDKHQVDIALQGHDHSYARGRVAPLGENTLSGLNTRDETGTVYVVSVSGGKMYQLREGWEDLGAQRDRAAENTQLFQVIDVNGDTLSYQAYTATGELYDAFDLIKSPDGGPNRFVERQQEAIAARRHDNTIAYEDELPQDVETMVMNRYEGYELDEVRYVQDADFTGYQVELEKGESEVNLKINSEGEIIEEVMEN
ncbi:MAG: metallophosphoesterase family protein [Bacteroidota bacterium]